MVRWTDRIIDYFRYIVERSAFGVCQDIGERIGIKASRIRIYFIYTSFITFGSPLIIYLVLAFWKNIRKYFTRTRDLLWD